MDQYVKPPLKPRGRRRELVEHSQTEWGRLRVARGMSLRDLQRETGIGRFSLSLMEQGRYVPTATEAAKLVAVLRPLDAGG